MSQPCTSTAPRFRAIAFFTKYSQHAARSPGKHVLLNFRFLQTIHAIRLVRGTNSSESLFVVFCILVGFEVSDRALGSISFARYDKLLKKPSLEDSEFDGVILRLKGIR